MAHELDRTTDSFWRVHSELLVDDLSTNEPELRRGSKVLLAALVGMMLGLSAIPFYTLSVFAGPVTSDTGWSMTEFQFHFTIVSLGVLAAPLHGMALDRFSPRKVILVSIAVFGMAVVLAGWLAMVGLWAFYAAWLVAALTGQSTGPVGWTKIITGWFDRRRGIALGVALSGSGLFAFIGPMLLDRLITEAGWQIAYASLGFAVLTINLPIALIFLRSPPKPKLIDSAKQQEFSWVEILSNYRFFLIVAAFALIGFAVAGLISNLVPILQLDGVPRSTAAGLAGLVGFSVLVARIVVGLLLDRFWPPAIAAISMSLPAISCLALTGYLDISPTLTVILIGFSAGAEFDILAYLVSRYFSKEAYGRIYGFAYMAMMAGAGIAPPIFGSNFDRLGDYSLLLHFSAAIFAIAPFSLLLLRNPPRPAVS